MRGLLLAGGTGSRLWPVTRSVSKQLLPIFDKPMIYYPLSTLIRAGIRETLIVTAPESTDQIRRLLGDGRQWGLRLEYAVQPRPEGIAQALLVGEEFLAGGPVALVLGDNILHGAGLGRKLSEYTTLTGARVFAYPVANPSAYGVISVDEAGRASSIEEKPVVPRSRYAVPGLYFYDGDAVKIAHGLRPSLRGELEITALNEEYLRRGSLRVTVLGRGAAWMDAGTFTTLMHASEYVRVIEERQGRKIGCVEEAAWRAGLIDNEQLRALALPLQKSGYGEYLLRLATEPGRQNSPTGGTGEDPTAVP
ncbi:glucose-1-phosphate thymidylyltransferase RfbA [Micromonospora sp. NPDC051141]|uniref:glucose-1-phosphate thymidylyltransferase RfbA n=1 Tax=Micromonospora sp. NPDC051141 TaxID=3364284 RepID=UPI0037974669